MPFCQRRSSLLRCVAMPPQQVSWEKDDWMECYRRTDSPEYQTAGEALLADVYGGSKENSAIVSNEHDTAFEKADSSHANGTSGVLLVKNPTRFGRYLSCEIMCGWTIWSVGPPSLVRLRPTVHTSFLRTEGMKQVVISDWPNRRGCKIAPSGRYANV